jgi:hypothetical protein
MEIKEYFKKLLKLILIMRRVKIKIPAVWAGIRRGRTIERTFPFAALVGFEPT